MHRRSMIKSAALASFTLCVAALVAGCAGGPGPDIVWGIVYYTPDDGTGSAIVEGTVTDIGGAALSYAGIVAHAYDAYGDLLATSPTVSISVIQPHNFVIYPGQTQHYDLAFLTSELTGVDRFRILIASSLEPIRETGWQALYDVYP